MAESRPFRIPDEIDPAQWAALHRRLQRSYAADAGPYEPMRTPYLIDVMNRFADPAVQRITVVKASRVGGTEAANNMLGWAMDCAPGPTVYVYPDEKSARDEATGRIKEFIVGSPKLKGHAANERDWCTGAVIRLDRMKVYMAWAGAPVTLTRITARYAFIDEIDNCDKQAGSLGDTVALTQKRLRTFGKRAKLVVTSSPTLDSAPAWRGYLRSDQNSFWWPCPHCGAYQVPDFQRVHIPKDCRDPDAIEKQQLAWLECAECHGEIRDEQHKRWMVERGRWIPHTQRPDESLPVEDDATVARAKLDAIDRWEPRLAGEQPVTVHAGYHVNGLLSPWVTWSQLRAEHLIAMKDPMELKVFINASLGEPWKDTAEEVVLDSVRAKCSGALPRNVVHADAFALTVGADVQKQMIYYVVRAWGPERKSWLVREGTCETFDELYALATSEFTVADSKESMRPKYLAVDSGYETDLVYQFARDNHGVYATKGVPGQAAPVVPRKVDYVSRQGARLTGLVRYNIDVDYYKDMLARAIKTPDGEPGCWSVHAETSEEYFQQLAAEIKSWKTVRRRGQKTRICLWEKRNPGLANHFLDCEVMALAIADYKGLTRIRPVRQEEVAAPAADSPSQVPYGRRPMGWHPTRLTSR